MAKSIKYTSKTISNLTVSNPSFYQIGALPQNQTIKSKVHRVIPSINTKPEETTPPPPESNILIVDSKYSPPPLINIDKFSKEPFDGSKSFKRGRNVPKFSTFLEDDNSVLTEFLFEPIPKNRYPHVHISEHNNDSNHSFTIVPPNVPPAKIVKAKSSQRKPKINKVQQSQINTYAPPGQISNFSNMDMQMMAHFFGMSTSELKRAISNKNARVAATNGYMPGFMPQNHFMGPM
ncbi:hypothetical protein GPJ56_001161 [Histomonas meleagridis]|uniref:uncharacterized protein n=1 Tax=Histomonas meleagridis TaxID=135588 RepID=UPI00355AC3D0|nr:hypothetical protein GPJ56_001161 [Histomonas meleagridis]KAH0799876.1 hypothetical protein GO595_006988 [Histomonas meleagridis]